MRNSKSKERKNTLQPSSIKVNQSQNPQPSLDRTQKYPRAMTSDTQKRKKIPPKVTVEKSEFKVEQNMTQSKIFVAKQGLQLLKNKMKKNGITRQRIASRNQVNNMEEQKPSFKKVKQKPERQYIGTKTGKIIEENMNNILTNIEKIQIKRSISKPTKDIKSDEVNNHDETAINQKEDFLKLLQKQMQRQRKLQLKNKNQISQDILVECNKGCGRIFSSQVLKKHEKVCQNVFQSKRQTFNSASHRKIQVEGYNQPKESTLKKSTKKIVKKQSKWKEKSNAFRAQLKQGKNVELNQEEKQSLKALQQNLVPCKFCGRKFRQQTAKRHVVFCESKYKQVSRNSSKRK